MRWKNVWAYNDGELWGDKAPEVDDEEYILKQYLNQIFNTIFKAILDHPLH